MQGLRRRGRAHRRDEPVGDRPGVPQLRRAAGRPSQGVYADDWAQLKAVRSMVDPRRRLRGQPPDPAALRERPALELTRPRLAMHHRSATQQHSSNTGKLTTLRGPSAPTRGLAPDRSKAPQRMRLRGLTGGQRNVTPLSDRSSRQIPPASSPAVAASRLAVWILGLRPIPPTLSGRRERFIRGFSPAAQGFSPSSSAFFRRLASYPQTGLVHPRNGAGSPQFVPSFRRDLWTNDRLVRAPEPVHLLPVAVGGEVARNLPRDRDRPVGLLLEHAGEQLGEHPHGDTGVGEMGVVRRSTSR